MARFGYGFGGGRRHNLSTESGVLTHQVISYGVAYNFSEPRAAGQYANGDWWVVGPVSITSISPASTLQSGNNGPVGSSGGAVTAYTNRQVHGTQVNPGNRSFATGGLLANNTTNRVQGWDSLNAIGGILSAPYSASANVDPGFTGVPLTVVTGSVVKMVSRLTGLPVNNRPVGNDMVVLTVVDSIPPADAIRPGVSRTDKTSLIRRSHFNLGVFQNLAPTANAPTYEQAVDWVDRYIETSQPDSINNGNAKAINNHPEYGRDIGNNLHRAMLCLHLSSFTTHQKMMLLSHMATIADDLVSRHEEGSITFGAGGGNQWKLPVIAMCAAALGSNVPATWLTALSSAERLDWAENRQIFTVAGPDMVIPRFTGDGRPRTIYTPQQVGAADWGEQHTEQPQYSGSNWDSFYRDIVAYSLLPGVLAVELTTGAKALWDFPQFWLYFDTVYGRRTEGGAGNTALPFTLEMVNAYRPAKTAAPAIVEAGVRGADMWLRCDLSLLDNVTAPATSAFTVLVNGSPATVSAVSIFRQNIGLTLASPVTGVDVVTVSYTAPGSNPARSVDGVNLASFSGQAVTNRTEKVGGTNSAYPVVRFTPGVTRRLMGGTGTLAAANSALGTMALMRFRFPAAPAADTIIFGAQSGTPDLVIVLTTTRRLEIRLRNAAGSVAYRAQTPVLAVDTDYDILWSWDTTRMTNTLGLDCFINGAAQTLNFITWTGGAGAVARWTFAAGSAIGGYAFNFGGTTFDMGALYLNTVARVDLTISTERDKFQPAAILTRGDGVTGAIPAHFFVGTADQWADTFGIQRGTGNRAYPSYANISLGTVQAVNGSEWR